MRKFITRYKQLPVQLRASAWFLICNFLQRGISVITTPIFTRLLSTTEYGQYSVFTSWMDILTAIVTLKLYAGVFMQGIVKFDEDKDRFSSSLQGLTCTLTVIWFAIYLIGHDFFNSLFALTTIQMVAMFSLILTTAIFSFWSVEQRTANNYKSLVIVTIVTSLAKPIFGIVLVLICEDKATARIIGLAAVEFVAYSWMLIRALRRGKLFFDKKYWKYALHFNIPLLPHYLSVSLLNSSDRIMIKKMVSESSAGIYSLAYSISLVMTLFNNALLQTIEPWLYKQIKAEKIKAIGRVAYVALIIIGTVNIALIAFAPEIVRIFAPIEYQEAIWVIPPVAMSVFFMFIYSLFAAFEFYYEKTNFITIATTIGAAVNIVLNFIFIDIYGYYAAGYTTLVCYIIFAVMHYCFMRKICNDELCGEQAFDIRVLLLLTSLFMILGFIFLFTYNNVLLRIGLMVILLMIFFVFRKVILQEIRSMMQLRKEH